MVQPETALQNRIRIRLSRACKDLVHFRNSVGALKDENGRMVQFGLGTGSPDLVGYKKVTVTPDMVGKDLAIFVGMEIKMPGKKPRADQKHWLDSLAASGGIAGFVTSEDQALDLVGM